VVAMEGGEKARNISNESRLISRHVQYVEWFEEETNVQWV